MLASLAVGNLDGWHMFVAVEPGPRQAEFTPICARYLAPDCYTVTINRKKLGVRGNPYQLIDGVFRQGSELNLCLEEDLILAPDAPDLVEWYFTNRQTHWACLNLIAGCCGNPGYMSHTAYPDLLFETNCFTPVGLAMTADIWPRFRESWVGPDHRVIGKYSRMIEAAKGKRFLALEGWDWALWGEVLADPKLRVVQPVAARVTHDGPDGHHVKEDFQGLAFEHISLVEVARNTADFRIVDSKSLPDQTRAHQAALEHASVLMAECRSIDYPLVPEPVRTGARLLTRIKGHPVDPTRRS